MTPQKFIDILEKSGNKLLSGAANDIMDWSKLKHNKECLELFLRNNIAVIKVIIGNKGVEYLVSSNIGYLGYVNNQRAQASKNKVVNIMTKSSKFSKILSSKNQDIVRTWNLISNDKIEIPMTNPNVIWAIQRWIGINSENTELLAIATEQVLWKGKNGHRT